MPLGVTVGLAPAVAVAVRVVCVDVLVGVFVGVPPNGVDTVRVTITKENFTPFEGLIAIT